MKLNPSQFIKEPLLEAVRALPGTRTEYDGGVWEFIGYDDGKQGGTWRIISGKNPNYNPNVTTKFFSYMHDPHDKKPNIFDGERFNQEVTGKREPLKDKRKSDVVGTIPPEVTDAASEYAYAKEHPGWSIDGHYVKKDPRFAYLYARDVLRGRFPLGEPIMKTSPDYWTRYAAMINRLSGK